MTAVAAVERDQRGRCPRTRERSWKLRLVAAWREQKEIERKRQRIGRIRLPSLWFRAAWIVVFVVRLVMFCYMLGLGLAYWFMASPVLASTRSAYDLPGSRAFSAISVFLCVGAVVYAVQLYQMLRFSIKQRRLAFRSQSPPLERAFIQQRHSLLRSGWSSCASLYSQVLGPKGLLGIEHPFFPQVLVLRELSEILLQGYQTYTLTTSVPRRWISDLAVALLVLNCWSTLLVHALGPKSLTAQRALCLAVDTALDFGWSVVIPVCIVAPYAAAYDPVLRAFPDHLLADYRWQLSWEMDVQQVCITSVLDFVSSLLPCASILLTSRSITRIIDEKQARVLPERSLPALSKHDGVRRPDPTQLVTPVPVVVRSRSRSSTSRSRNLSITATLLSIGGRIRSGSIRRSAHAPGLHRRRREQIGSHLAFFIALGLLIIGVHVYAVTVADDHSVISGCVVQVRPWFTRRHECVYANVNCADDGDDRPELAARLAALQPRALRYLVIAHASRLTVPRAITRFSNLRMMEIYNSTVVEWPLNAAITARTQPQLRRLGLIRTNLSRLPDALVAHEAPFVFVNLVATNLTTVPDAALASWRALRYFNMEHGRLRALPPAIAAMAALQRLSVCDNEIAELPPALPGAYTALNVARNPLRALPETLRDISRLRLLTFERTCVTVAPSWLADAIAAHGARLTVAGVGSPLCASGGGANATTACAAPSRYVDGHYLLAAVARFMPVADSL